MTPDKKGARWSEVEFFATGRHEIQAVLERITGLGIGLNFEKALDCLGGR